MDRGGQAHTIYKLQQAVRGTAESSNTDQAVLNGFKPKDPSTGKLLQVFQAQPFIPLS